MNELIVLLDIKESKGNKVLILQMYETDKVSHAANGRYNGSYPVLVPIEESKDFSNVSKSLVLSLLSKYCFKVDKNKYYLPIDKLSVFYNEIKKFELLYIQPTDNLFYYVNDVNEGLCSTNHKFDYMIGNFIISFNKNKSEIKFQILKQEVYSLNQPKPLLTFDEREKMYKLSFSYVGFKVDDFSGKSVFRIDEKIMFRDYRFENFIIEKLLNLNFIKKNTNRFSYCGTLLKYEICEELQKQGIIFVENNDVINPTLKISRKPNNNWFEISITANIDGSIVDLANKIDLYSKDNEIVINNKRVVIPESISDNISSFKKENGVLLFEKKNTFGLLQLIRDSNLKISDYFPYEKVVLDENNKTLKNAYIYQKQGVKWLKYLLLNNLGGCLSDDMGLGKTFQIISFMEDCDVKKRINKTLIVVPKSLLTNWKKEFEKFDSSFSVGIYYGNNRNESIIIGNDVIISTYATVRLDIDLLSHYFDLIIFDEIQTIKNEKSITSKTLKKFSNALKFGLSGTPMENNISELWNIMDVLNPGLLGTKQKFLRRFTNENIPMIVETLSPFILRRMKKDYLKELPDKNIEYVFCDMDSKQEKLYNSINLSVLETLRNNVYSDPSLVLKGILLLRECCCHTKLLNEKVNIESVDESCKLDNLKLIVENSISNNHKILIFSQFTKMLTLIKETLALHYKNIFYLDGATSNREKVISDFENTEKAIFLISIKAGGVGLNLTSAQDVIIFDPWWNPFVEEQAIDRAYRIGQKNPVTVYKLIAANTLEEKIVDMQNNKSSTFNAIINGISNNKEVSFRDLKKILEQK